MSGPRHGPGSCWRPGWSCSSTCAAPRSRPLPAEHDPATATTNYRYLAGLRDCLAGDYQWHLETRRYRAEPWQRKPRAGLSGPRGLGTSAARLGTGIAG
ncbi:hypothetical protein M8C13_38495 [Crossiella sp. SN42]|uniref:hypothetical protein n=1 Tax=Crossiella sp. SN42 TaxID=2944808 RepID=UPI00207C700B|nr:hypothetical protein [Crossiella sp. SN42]MCO1581655.1 hypothetical protein [Crossiella sp. SN42]